MTKAAKRPPLRVDVTPAAAGPPAALKAWARMYVRALAEAEGIVLDGRDAELRDAA